VVEGAHLVSKEIGANGADKTAMVAAYLKDSPEGMRVWLVYDQKGVLDYNFLNLRISHILESFCAHACLLYKGCMSHFGEQAFWDRKGALRAGTRRKR